MAPDISDHGTAAPRFSEPTTQRLAVESDQLFNAEINTIDPAKITALEILRRHRQLRSFDSFRSSRLAASRPLVLITMAIYHGERQKHSADLLVTAAVDEIADSSNLQVGVVYPALRDLVACGFIRRIKSNDGRCDCFEIVMPAVPKERGDLERAHNRSARARSVKDLDCAPVQQFHRDVERAHALDSGARAPVHQSMTDADGQPHFATGNTVGDPGARARSTSPDQIRSDLTSDLISDQGRSEGPNWIEQATELLIANCMPPGNAKAVAAHPHCTPTQLGIAIDHLEHRKRTGTLRTVPGKLLTSAIKNRWGPLDTAEQRRRSNNPEHVQEADSAELISARAEQARERRSDQAIAELSPDQRSELIREAIAALPENDSSPLVARMYEQCLNGRPLVLSLKRWMHERILQSVITNA